MRAIARRVIIGLTVAALLAIAGCDRASASGDDSDPCVLIRRRDVAEIFGRPTGRGTRDIDNCSWDVRRQFAVSYTPLRNIPTGGGHDILAGRRSQTPGPTHDVDGVGDDAYYDVDLELCSAQLNVRDGDVVFIVHVTAVLPFDPGDPCLPAKARRKLVGLAELVVERRPR